MDKTIEEKFQERVNDKDYPTEGRVAIYQALQLKRIADLLYSTTLLLESVTSQGGGKNAIHVNADVQGNIN